MARILFISHDQVGALMAAPGIRSAEISRELAARGHAVTLAIPNDPDISIEGVTQVADDLATVQSLAERSDVVITGGGPLGSPQIEVPLTIPHVVDMSFPIILETLSSGGDHSHGSEEAAAQERHLRESISRRLLAGDLLLCASREQWQFYLGWLAALGRLTFAHVRNERSLGDLLAIVPFGCPASPPHRTAPAIRGQIAGISRTDFVLVWSGYISDWYDPETAIRAVSAAAHDVTDLRLMFMGARPKGGRLAESHRSALARALADSLGVTNRHVFFHDEWVEYGERANWLLDADAAIVAAPRSVESKMSVRARFFDYVWTATPTITSRGGSIADTVERERFGIVVEPEDVNQMIDAIRRMADPSLRAEFRRNLEQRRDAFTWARAVDPLVAFCEHPRLSGDRKAMWPASR